MAEHKLHLHLEFEDFEGQTILAVFIGDNRTGEDEPIITLPIRGEMTSQRQNEISRQVGELLKACIVTPGTNEHMDVVIRPDLKSVS